ncbi:MAG: V-type ATPase 116kDa subunit family protein [Coriobacteriia bacterium]|nr:V-type ATPase 116kDa subunit family protein [Coriobacteriia bacterium]
MLVPMARVEIIGPKNRFFEVVSLLHEQGTLHIEDLTKKIGSGEMPVDQMEVLSGQQIERERMEDLLIRVRAIIKALHIPGSQVEETSRQREYLSLWKLSSDELSTEIANVIAEVEDRTSGLAQSQTDLENDLSLLGRYEPILHKIQPLARQIVTTGNFDSVALLIERRYKGLLDQLKEELDKITKKQCEIVSTDVDEDTTAAIVVFSKVYSEPVHKFLAMENVNQIRLPSDMQGMPFDEAYEQIRVRRREMPAQLQEVRSELEVMSAKWYLRLTTIRDVLMDKLDEISAIPKFGQTEYAFVITGYVPIEEMTTMRKGLVAAFGDDVIVNQKEITEKEFADTPVALKNSKAMQPFQSLLSVYGMPRYGTMDPTWMLFVFYPVFFGMIVGDIGYGLIMLGIVLWMRFRYKENETIQLATSVLGPASTMVVAFGFLYAEFFGNWLYVNKWIIPIPLGPMELPFERVVLVQEFMYLAVAVGVLQILLGLAFGIVNAVRTKNKHHLFEKGGILTFLLGVFIALGIGAATSFFGSWTIWGQGLFALVALSGFIFAVRGGGVMGVVETVESVTHIASYIRIMAVGLAGAIFADAVNSMMQKSGNIVAAVLIGIFLHGLNFIIAAFSPTIHALRLNFLEFFGKFYETGTKEYSPFHKTGGERQA